MKSFFAIFGLLSVFALSTPVLAAEKSSQGVIVVDGGQNPSSVTITSSSDGTTASASGGVLVLTSTGTAPGGMLKVFTSTGSLTASGTDAKGKSGKSIVVIAKDGKVTSSDGGKDSDVKVEALSFGKVIEMGPDGKVEVKDILGEMPPEMMKNLPQDVRDAIKKLHAQAGAAVGGGVLGKPNVHGKMKIVVEKDGKRNEYETDLGDPQADGGAGAMPAEAQKAFESVRKAMQAREAKVRAAMAERKGGDVSEKLDKILERLDHIEADVNKLKENEKK